MSARPLEGRTTAAQLRSEARQRADRIAARTGHRPRLAIVHLGADEAAAVYLRSVSRAAERSGLEPVVVSPAPELAAVSDRIAALNADPRIAGIVVTQPLPGHLDPRAVVALIDPAKDVDGATAVNAGHLARSEPSPVPATALAVMRLLEAHDLPVAGRRAVVVGRSSVIGRPVALLLLAADATVTVCHSRTRELATETRRAELLVVAAGSAGLITAEMVAPGTVVVDCGINPTANGVVGDVAPEVAGVAAALSPVPGGVGPLTAMMLVSQTLDAAERRLDTLDT